LTFRLSEASQGEGAASGSERPSLAMGENGAPAFGGLLSTTGGGVATGNAMD